MRYCPCIGQKTERASRVQPTHWRVAIAAVSSSALLQCTSRSHMYGTSSNSTAMNCRAKTRILWAGNTHTHTHTRAHNVFCFLRLYPGRPAVLDKSAKATLAAAARERRNEATIRWHGLVRLTDSEFLGTREIPKARTQMATHSAFKRG